MARLLQRIEYDDRAENWALGVISSAGMLVLGAEPGTMGRERLGDIWALYIDAADRLLDGQRRTRAAAEETLAVLDDALQR
jgi:hypothetical protein